MNNHNDPGQNLTNGECGPDDGPNCSSCRVLLNEQLDIILGEDKWQGMSGMIYCGRQIGIYD